MFKIFKPYMLLLLILLASSSIAMTEKYTGFKLRRLMDDFPSLKPQIQARLDKSVMDSGLTELANNYLQLG